MKKPSFNNIAAITIFVLAISAALLVVRPVYTAVSREINSRISGTLKEFQERTGLSISYRSLSPSVFTGLNIRNIVLTDVSNGKSVVEIKKTIVKYSIPGFIAGKGLSAVRSVTVDGFVLEVDMDEIPDMKKIRDVSEKKVQDISSSGKKNQESVRVRLLKLEESFSTLPFNVFVKNFHVMVKKGQDTMDLYLKKITLAFMNVSRQLMVKTSGTLQYSAGGGKIYSAGFSADGYVPEKLEGSAITFRFSDISSGDLAVNHLNLVLNYRKEKVEIKTVQNGYPLFFSASYDFASGDASFAFHTKKLKARQLVTVKKSDAMLRKIRNLSVTLNAGGTYFSEEGRFQYSSDGSVSVPDQLYSGGFVTDFALDGDNTQISVRKFNSSGEKIDVDFSGSCIFEGLKLSGVLSVNDLAISNGGIISTEVYFDPEEKGFTAFAPQFMMDEKAFTALQLKVTPVNDSVDFSFELSDYSHTESDSAGLLKVDGSYIGGTKYVQANVSSSGMYLDSLAQTGAFFGKKKSSSAFKFLSSCIFNGELFVSTDFANVSYNVPYAFVANTKKENQMLFLSLDGNGSSVQVSRIDFLSAGKMYHLSGMFEKSPDGGDAFFMADMNADSVPYHFTGTVMPGNFSMTGDYGLSLNIRKSFRKKLEGNFTCENIPVVAADTIFTVSADTEFSCSQDNGISVKLNRVEGSEAGSKFAFAPVFKLSGSVSKYGAFLDAISYSDRFSSLEGSSELLWNVNDSVFDSASFNFNMKNPVAPEAVSVSLNLSNPELVPFSAENLKEKFYFNSQIVLTALGLSRVTAEHSENNTVSGTVIASGTIANPYVGLNLDSLNLMTAGKTVALKCSAYVEEKNLTVNEGTLNYNNAAVKGIKALFDLNTFTGNASGTLDTIVAKKTVHAPLELSVSDTVKEKGKLLPSEFAANIISEGISGTFFKKTVPFSLSILRSGGITNVFTSQEQGISGTITDDGLIDFSVAKGKPVQFNLSGNIKDQNLNIKMQNISVDAGQLFTYVDIDRLKLYNGILKGRIDISGLKSDPEFKGSLAVSQADFSLPKIISQHITVQKALLVLNGDQIEMPAVTGYVKKDYPISAKLNVFFDRWSFDHLELKLKNPENVYMPGDFEIRLAHFIGFVNLDLLLKFQDHYLDVTGDVNLKKLTGSVKTRELANAPPKRTWWPRADIKFNFGQHCTFIFDPLLRAVIVPDTDLGFKYDMAASDLELDGELAFRSGDISYLSRNFYLKNGSMRFNSNDPTFNPLISVRAETRERDDDGNDVRIILSATNQYLLNFNAQFSSIPAKSETEIRTLLGQIAVGDSDNVSSLLFATGDYALQSTVGRSIENKLRDFLNFDILSVRTNVLQNALSYGLLNSKTDESEKKNLTIGNFFDNSTVYLGKYFGSSLYMDALMHWSYDETRVDDSMVVSGLVFRPEFGLEVESPFGNIRWNMAPDINGIRNDKFVSSTSVTLSWKFSF